MPDRIDLAIYEKEHPTSPLNKGERAKYEHRVRHVMGETNDKILYLKILTLDLTFQSLRLWQ
jgi:hypothetical protein